MRAEAHLSVARTDVRGCEIKRHAAARFRQGRAFAVSTGLGLPRLYRVVSTHALAGMASVLDSSTPLRGEKLMQAALDAARDQVAAFCESLIERMLPDATITAALIDEGTLHVISAGPGRVYLHRNDVPQRLTPRDEQRDGVLRATPTRCAVPLDPSDIVLLGSLTAFTVQAVSQLGTILKADPATPVAVLANVLTEPAAQAGIGAASVAIRIR